MTPGDFMERPRHGPNTTILTCYAKMNYRSHPRIFDVEIHLVVYNPGTLCNKTGLSKTIL